MTRLIGSIETGNHARSNGRRYAVVASMLFVACVAAILIVPALAMTGSAQTKIAAKAPGPPHGIWGFTYDADGTTPLPGCFVTITNTNTSESVVWDDTREGWDPAQNVYSIDMSEFQLGYAFGDILNVTARLGIQVGWSEAPVTDNVDGYDQIDVTLDGIDTSIPEFPMLIVPITGMIALFAVVSVRRKKH